MSSEKSEEEVNIRGSEEGQSSLEKVGERSLRKNERMCVSGEEIIMSSEKKS